MDVNGRMAKNRVTLDFYGIYCSTGATIMNWLEIYQLSIRRLCGSTTVYITMGPNGDTFLVFYTVSKIENKLTYLKWQTHVGHPQVCLLQPMLIMSKSIVSYKSLSYTFWERICGLRLWFFIHGCSSALSLTCIVQRTLALLLVAAGVTHSLPLFLNNFCSLLGETLVSLE